jgi:hypothetical protein
MTYRNSPYHFGTCLEGAISMLTLGPLEPFVTERRFPPPWSVDELGSSGQKLAYVYFEDEPGRRSAAKLLTKDEARRIAVNIAKLAALIGRPRKT